MPDPHDALREAARELLSVFEDLRDSTYGKDHGQSRPYDALALKARAALTAAAPPLPERLECGHPIAGCAVFSWIGPRPEDLKPHCLWCAEVKAAVLEGERRIDALERAPLPDRLGKALEVADVRRALRDSIERYDGSEPNSPGREELAVLRITLGQMCAAVDTARARGAENASGPGTSVAEGRDGAGDASPSRHDIPEVAGPIPAPASPPRSSAAAGGHLDGLPIGHLVSVLYDVSHERPLKREDREALEKWRSEKRPTSFDAPPIPPAAAPGEHVHHSRAREASGREVCSCGAELVQPSPIERDTMATGAVPPVERAAGAIERLLNWAESPGVQQMTTVHKWVDAARAELAALQANEESYQRADGVNQRTSAALRARLQAAARGPSGLAWECYSKGLGVLAAFKSQTHANDWTRSQPAVDGVRAAQPSATEPGVAYDAAQELAAVVDDVLSKGPYPSPEEIWHRILVLARMVRGPAISRARNGGAK